MESTISVSKGCFVFKNGFTASSKHRHFKDGKDSLFEQEYTSELWYEAYKNMWHELEKQTKIMNSTTYNKILSDLVKYIKDCYNSYTSMMYDSIIPCATLLTGINHPDHNVQFLTLKEQLLSEVTPHVAVIISQDASTLKQIIENMILQFINNDYRESDSEGSPEKPKLTNSFKIKKSQCNMTVLKAWYQEMYKPMKSNELSPSKKTKSHSNVRNSLVVIIPDFEGFNCEILQKFILILSGYTPQLPFVLVFGVATAVSALHKSFPYHVSSRLFVQVFQSHSSTLYLNQILDNIFLHENCPFHLSTKVFLLLMDVFLFYDFSVTGFIQNMKYCMMEHYFGTKINSLCCSRDSIVKTISLFSDEDLEDVRHLPSFRPYVESKPAAVRISLLTSNDFFRIDLAKALDSFHDYLGDFHIGMKILLAIVGHLPNAPLGKQIREIYSYCVSSHVMNSPEYKQCMLLIGFLSKEELLESIDNSLKVFDNVVINDKIYSTPKKHSSVKKSRDLDSVQKNFYQRISSVKNNFVDFKERLLKANLEHVAEAEATPIEGTEKLSRQNLKQVLLKSSTKERFISEYEKVRKEFLNYLTKNVVELFLKPPNTQPFNEIFFFTSVNKVKRHIVGTPRASIHTALNNPSVYLQCKCCSISSQDTILPTMPDICIVYKLHLECGKLINLYDWLQAFLTIVDPVDSDNDEEERREVDPQIQARFTRAVSELQFLGFIKTSKRKTDHVARLTW